MNKSASVILSVILCLLLGLAGACNRASAPAGNSGAQLSYVNTGDVRARPQLLSGWYGIENASWRWMGREAEAALLVPRQAPLNFELRIVFPPDHMRKAGGPVMVSVLLNDTLFAQETYAEPGSYVIHQPVPPGILAAGTASVKIRLDRAVPPGDVDKRELGAVVQGLGFVH